MGGAQCELFAREGADLRLELPITLYEAVLGAKVRVPTLDGAVELGDGVVVGSAIVRAAETSVEAALALAASLRTAIDDR